MKNETLYIEYLKEQENKLESIITMDPTWKPQIFKKNEGVMVCRAIAPEDKIKELQDAGFRVHVDK